MINYINLNPYHVDMGEETSNLNISKTNNSIKICLNTKIYPINVIYAACYSLLDQVYVHIDGNPTSEMIIELEPKIKSNLEQLSKEFENEIIKHAFYNAQNKDSTGTKILMLKRILAMPDTYAQINVPEEELGRIQEKSDFINNIKKDEQSLNDDDIEDIAVPWEEKYGKEDTDKPPEDLNDDDFLDDPEGIAIPWEEKYGKDDNKSD